MAVGVADGKFSVAVSFAVVDGQNLIVTIPLSPAAINDGADSMVKSLAFVPAITPVPGVQSTLPLFVTVTSKVLQSP
ncbi:hypothetical protein D3C83_138680 [compost metagenome]